MTHRFVRDTRLALAATALFLLNVAVPRAGMFYHEHPNGIDGVGFTPGNPIGVRAGLQVSF